MWPMPPRSAKVEDASSQDAWRLVLRRAFEIPDIVGDDTALDAIAFDVAGQVEPPHDFNPLTVAEGLTRAVLELGPAGSLDDIFFAEEKARFLMDRIPGDQNPVERIVTKTIEGGIRGPATVATGLAWRKMAKYVLDKVAAQVAGTTYETDRD